ncbi:hypothetical protein HY229_08170 [Candidatus Acetothermia bacterium]|nr:hypothetical protein [Candidatus Acetothermia bacterium]MBI3644056.1 hypothetical protein [Candidatus Acetothermia bacterium]
MSSKKLHTAGKLTLVGLVLALVVTTVPTLLTQAHDVSLIKKTITIEMNEFSYTVDGVANGPVNLKVGDVTTLIFINKGKITHDAHFGTDPDLKGRLFNNNIVAPFDMLVLEAGERAQLTFTAKTAGTFELGCFQPGHYEAGMKVAFVIQN